jgi:hypothetical protein
MLCLLCDTPLTPANRSREHILPNALGGRISTRKAFCRQCNSQLGSKIDNVGAREFSYFANAFYVPRERGEHPSFDFVDSISGKKLEFFAGREKPVVARNFSFEKTATGAVLKFNSTTEKDGRDFLEQKLRELSKRHQIANSEFSYETEADPDYQFDMAIPILSDHVLKLIAKISLAYARHIGLALCRNDPLTAFLRGTNNMAPVGIPGAAVVETVTKEEVPLRHQIYVFCPTSEPVAFVYVRLFEVFEYVSEIALAQTSALSLAGYSYSLIAGESEDASALGCATPEQFRHWIVEKRLQVERWTELQPRLIYWVQNRPVLWTRRALTRAFHAFFEALDGGSTMEQANRRAQYVCDLYLQTHHTSEGLQVKFSAREA